MNDYLTAPQRQMAQQQIEQMRPTLIIGAGGTGQIILTQLKGQLQKSFGQNWQEKIRLLAFDTTEETFQLEAAEQLVSLESGAEFFDVGNVPVGSIMRNEESQAAIHERLGSVMSQLPAGVLRNGSKQMRPFGLMALLWNHAIINEQIRHALWQLAGRSQSQTIVSQQQGINVFLCGSLVGGTGSGIMLDLAYLVRDAFTDLGTQAEFCHITCIGFLPQAFHGIKGPNMLPNTAAFLNELNYLMVKGNFKARYPDGRIIQSRETPVDIFYALDGVDQSGRTWPDVFAVSNMAAKGIYLQMGTQMGKKGENAFDNLDEILSGIEQEGQGTFVSSFGQGEIVFDSPAVAEVCTRWYLADLIAEQWLAPSRYEEGFGVLQSILDGIRPDALRSALLSNPETDSPLHINLNVPSWLQQKGHADVPMDAKRYLVEYGRARVEEQINPQITKNGEKIVRTIVATLTRWSDETLFAPQQRLFESSERLQNLHRWLEELLANGQKLVHEQTQRQAQLKQAVGQMETAVSKAATSFPFGRTGRLRERVSRLFRAVQQQLEASIEQQLLRSQLAVWLKVQQWVAQRQTALSRVQERLAEIGRTVQAEADACLTQLNHSGVASLSLADAAYVTELYRQQMPNRVDIRDLGAEPAELLMLPQQALQGQLLGLLAASFTTVAQLTIEQVIEARSSEISPRGRRQQLFQLSTPSWNIDRARLPEGGSHLVRLEILGVPDVNQSLFEGEPMLVSTHDPHRLTALVVVAGAPPSALQQYRQYHHALEQLKGRRPVYILPDFLNTTDQSHLLFALGSIFGLIYSQGTFFYYKPADPLASPLKLANGLSNAISAFGSHEEAMAEVSERIESQIARLGLREAINVLTNYVESVPNGNTALDEQMRALKRLVRDYVDSLRRIDAFSVGIYENGKGRLVKE